MGNNSFSEIGLENIPEEIIFLIKPQATELFNDIYDKLRGGVHIQKQSHDKLFTFIENNEKSIKAFFLRFNETELCSRGQQNEKYYFCDFLESTRGKTSHEYMKNEILIVGFLLFKLINLDGYPELESIAEFKKAILNDYEHYKKGIIKSLAKATREENNFSDDGAIKSTIDTAFKEFNKICWIKLYDKDRFSIYPSFNRIIDKYSDKINTIDIWLVK
jgi:hypothetical protein